MTDRYYGGAYRSKGEQALGQTLDRLGVRYTYEPRLTLYDPVAQRYRWTRPDFYLIDYGLVVEYAGMLDQPDYRDRHLRKAKLYQANGVPMLEVVPEDLEVEDVDSSLLEHIILSASGTGVPDLQSNVRDHQPN